MMTGNGAGRDASEGAPDIEPYKPFPAFSDWSQASYDQNTISRFIDQLDELKAAVDESVLRESVAIATKWAAVNTGAIEGLFQVDRGFTYSVAANAAAWDGMHATKGQFAADSIADAMRAYEFVLDAATGARPISEVWIRTLHSTVVSSQAKYTVLTAVGSQEQDLPKGEYKRYPNNPLNFEKRKVHSYAPPLDTPSEMARLIDEMRTAAFASAHPVIQAAYAHYAFVCVHPFADGNGRVARALAATFLYRSVGVPLVIFADQKGDYLDALEAADAGSPERFLRFISERVVDTIQMVKEQARTAAIPAVQDQLRSLTPLLSGLGGLAHAEIDAITIRVRGAFAAALEKVVEESPLSDTMSASVHSIGADLLNRPADYRVVPNDLDAVQLAIEGRSPTPVVVSLAYKGITRLPSSDQPDFAVATLHGAIVLTADLREVHPTISQAFVFRAEAAAMGQLRQLVGVAARRIEGALRDAGYA